MTESAADERRAVVAWLRDKAVAIATVLSSGADDLRTLADAIERGEHLKVKSA